MARRSGWRSASGEGRTGCGQSPALDLGNHIQQGLLQLVRGAGAQEQQAAVKGRLRAATETGMGAGLTAGARGGRRLRRRRDGNGSDLGNWQLVLQPGQQQPELEQLEARPAPPVGGHTRESLAGAGQQAGNVFFHHHVEVGAAEAERADPGPADLVAGNLPRADGSIHLEGRVVRNRSAGWDVRN